MVQRVASSAAQYVKQLPDESKLTINLLRKIVKENLQPGFQESINWGMIVYQVPKKLCSETYNGEPLAYVGLAAQKNYFSLYLLGLYGDEKLAKKFESAFKKSGKKLNMGKSCLRFKSVEELPMDVIKWAVGRHTVDEYIEMHNASMSLRKSKKLKRVE